MMANRQTHVLVGTAIGAIFAAYRAKGQADEAWLLEVISGGIGGYVGGRLPDILEPAASSWHRNTAHSCAAGGTIFALNELLSKWEAVCRENAEKYKALKMALEDGGQAYSLVPSDPISSAISQLVELFWRILAGFLNGVAAGYVSHLALDACSSRSIPLLVRGC